MDKKEVKIIGLSLNENLGILQACKLEFDENQRVFKIKGGVGDGKTTLQKSLQLGTQGSKSLTDKNLYGNIDTETQLLDGDIKIYVGCKSDKKGNLVYSIYTKDENGGINKNPVIDGVEATPAKYLETLQTALTWRMDELTSENPTVQKKILMKLYQHKLKDAGVIFDKKASNYKDSILWQIEEAEKERAQTDALRKQYGGIAEDLKARGYDVHKPETLPTRTNTDEIIDKINKISQDIAFKSETEKNNKNKILNDIKHRGEILKQECILYNNQKESEFKEAYSIRQREIENWDNIQQERQTNLNKAEEALKTLYNLGYKGAEIDAFILSLPKPSSDKPINETKKPVLIQFDEKTGNIVVTEETKAIKCVSDISELRIKYEKEYIKEINTDTKKEEAAKIKLEEQLEQAKELNKVCDAIDYFNRWQTANNNVIALKRKYYKMLADINTGVHGLKIIPEESNTGKIDLYLMYDGSYDPAYFSNPNAEMRKLSSYSGTQKPVICLLIQNYLLNQKPKSMRYMYIDNIPMDKKTIKLLEDMSEKLELRIFLNITGDFEQSKLQNGEFLIDGGEVFFN